jgi:hypothetical protein
LIDDCKFNIKAILGLLNSRLISWLYSVRFTNESTLTVNLSKEYLSKIPISINTPSIETELIQKVDLLIKLNYNTALFSSKFSSFFSQTLSIIDYSTKLKNWHELEFGDFIKELNKAINSKNKELLKAELQQIPTLTKKDEFEWLDLFEENKQKAQDLQNQINQTDKEIDAMVYQLYNLTDEEIKIIENS